LVPQFLCGRNWRRRWKKKGGKRKGAAKGHTKQQIGIGTTKAMGKPLMAPAGTSIDWLPLLLPCRCCRAVSAWLVGGTDCCCCFGIWRFFFLAAGTSTSSCSSSSWHFFFLLFFFLALFLPPVLLPLAAPVVAPGYLHAMLLSFFPLSFPLFGTANGHGHSRGTTGEGMAQKAINYALCDEIGAEDARGRSIFISFPKPLADL
jgi:hypothetical protein